MPLISNTRGTGAPGGVDGSLQYKSGTGINGESELAYDEIANELDIAGTKMTGMSAPIILNDNTSVFTTFLTISAIEFSNLVLECTIIRDGKRQRSDLEIVHDGLTTFFNHEILSSNLQPLGVNFEVALVGSDIQVRYTTTATGFNASLRYRIRGNA